MIIDRNGTDLDLRAKMAAALRKLDDHAVKLRLNRIVAYADLIIDDEALGFMDAEAVKVDQIWRRMIRPVRAAA